MSIVNDFKTFILRGNMIDLAVGVVVGAAFTGVVTAFTKDIIAPLIGIPGKISLGDISFSIHGSRFLIGEFFNAAISFLLTAFVVFFFVVRPVNWLMSRRKSETPVNPATRECPYCLSSIPIKATRCAFCTAEVSAEATSAVTST
jgi:large conductance mechanosensitive channel